MVYNLDLWVWLAWINFGWVDKIKFLKMESWGYDFEFMFLGDLNEEKGGGDVE